MDMKIKHLDTMIENHEFADIFTQAQNSQNSTILYILLIMKRNYINKQFLFVL